VGDAMYDPNPAQAHPAPQMKRPTIPGGPYFFFGKVN